MLGSKPASTRFSIFFLPLRVLILIGWYFLKALERLGLVWDLKVVPFYVREGLPNPRLGAPPKAA